jgi:hypothetical protein
VGTPVTIEYLEDAEVGYRWFAKTGEKPLYAFGHGLSYTTFDYSDLSVQGSETVTATFTVTNTGERAGAAVPQLYLTEAAGDNRTRLLGFERVELEPGQSRSLTLTAEPTTPRPVRRRRRPVAHRRGHAPDRAGQGRRRPHAHRGGTADRASLRELIQRDTRKGGTRTVLPNYRLGLEFPEKGAAPPTSKLQPPRRTRAEPSSEGACPPAPWVLTRSSNRRLLPTFRRQAPSARCAGKHSFAGNWRREQPEVLCLPCRRSRVRIPSAASKSPATAGFSRVGTLRSFVSSRDLVPASVHEKRFLIKIGVVLQTFASGRTRPRAGSHLAATPGARVRRAAVCPPRASSRLSIAKKHHRSTRHNPGVTAPSTAAMYEAR